MARSELRSQQGSMYGAGHKTTNLQRDAPGNSLPDSDAAVSYSLTTNVTMDMETQKLLWTWSCSHPRRHQLCVVIDLPQQCRSCRTAFPCSRSVESLGDNNSNASEPWNIIRLKKAMKRARSSVKPPASRPQPAESTPDYVVTLQTKTKMEITTLNSLERPHRGSGLCQEIQHHVPYDI